MSNTETTTPATPAKKMWTRCSGCRDRIYNDPQRHQDPRTALPPGHAPRDPEAPHRVLGDPSKPKDPDSLLARTAVLEQTVGDLDEHITAEPTLDPDGIDPDAYIDVIGDTTPDDDDEYETPDSVAPATPAFDPSGMYTPSGITAADVEATPWRPNDL
jgi:hypothetical protein